MGGNSFINKMLILLGQKFIRFELTLKCLKNQNSHRINLCKMPHKIFAQTLSTRFGQDFEVDVKALKLKLGQCLAAHVWLRL